MKLLCSNLINFSLDSTLSKPILDSSGWRTLALGRDKNGRIWGARQIVIASRNNIVETNFLWNADYLDCGDEQLVQNSDFIYRRSVINNISIDCFHKIYVEFKEETTNETLFLAEYNVSNTTDLSSFDFFINVIPTIYIPSSGGYVTGVTPAVTDPNITAYGNLYGFRLLISTNNLDTFYAGIHEADDHQFLSAKQPTGINVSGSLYNETTYLNSVRGSNVRISDYISVSVDSRDDVSCIYNNPNDIDNCTIPTVTTEVPRYELTVGEQVNLSCSYEDSFPKVQGFKWYKDKNKINDLNSTDGSLTSNETDFTLRITSATIYDMGWYQCYVYTPIFYYTHANIKLGAPPFLSTYAVEGQQGQSFDFCKIYTYPTEIDVTILKEESNNSKAVNVMKWYSSRNKTYGISNAQCTDTGNYTCIAVNSFGTTIGDSVEVIIYGAIISISSNANNIIFGEQIILTCHVVSMPQEHEFFWMFNESQIVTSSQHQISVMGDTHKLQVSAVTFGDEGYYGCFVNNGKVNKTNAIFINVIGDVPFIYINQTYVTANNSDKVILHCNFDAFPNTTLLYWTKQLNGTELTISPAATGGNVFSPQLVFENVQGSDRGDYICHVGNIVGNTSGNPVHLLINTYPPIVTSNLPSQVNVNLSDSVMLTCIVDATPDITVLYWTRTISGQVINISTLATGGTPASPNLIFDSAKWTDSGIYTCHAGNELGNVSGNPIDLQVDTGEFMFKVFL